MAIITTRDGAQIIRIAGQAVDTIRPADLDAASSDAELESDLMTRIEAGARDAGVARLALIHIADRSGKDYVIGLRRADWSLPAEAVKRGLAWWEWPPRPANTGSEIDNE
jgi:hypothetical protein